LIDVDYREVYPGHPVVGDIRVVRAFRSPELDNERDLLVYLPPSHATDPSRRFPVVYMHDGQNLFDAATSFAGEWAVDESMEALAAEGREAIVVAIPNMGARRIDEYSPFRDPRLGGGLASEHVRFVADTVKPAIDAAYRTRPERGATIVAGSSLGGVVSLWAFFERPEVFGGALAFSPALLFAGGGMLDWIDRRGTHDGRLYVDVGFLEGSHRRRPKLNLRRAVPPYVRAVRRAARRLEGRVRTFRFVEDPNGRHDEQAWARRFPDAIRFALG
jgi:predicted alpha/beta superfamily hydrolase